MNLNLLHTPDGVRDIYGNELYEKGSVSDSLMDTISSYGYSRIETPTIEFFDCFSNDIGTISSKELYKFFDKEGNTLCLRPDFTPSIARCAAKYFKEFDTPLRFCYKGNTFVNATELQGKLNESTEIGVELINDSTIEADAELLCLVIDSLKALGLKEFLVSVGEINYFKGICESANLDEETEMTLRDYISSKNYFLTGKFLSDKGIDNGIIKSFEAISKLFMTYDDMYELMNHCNNERSRNAISHLLKLKDILAKRGYDKYISFDLSMLSKYHYYTGIIFKAYTNGVGDAIVKGGRYDTLLEKFGFDAPSVGCVFQVDELILALKYQKIDIELHKKERILIYYNSETADAAYDYAGILRSNGKSVTLVSNSSVPEDKLDKYVTDNDFDKVQRL